MDVVQVVGERRSGGQGPRTGKLRAGTRLRDGGCSGPGGGIVRRVRDEDAARRAVWVGAPETPAAGERHSGAARYGAAMFHVVKTSKTTGEVIETIFSEPTRDGAQAMLRQAQAGPPLQSGHRLEIIEQPDDEGSDDSDLDDNSGLDDEEK